MYVRMKPDLHTCTKRGVSFVPLLQTSYISKDVSQGVMTSKVASNNPGLCPVKERKSGVCSWTRAQNQFFVPVSGC
jgi:hypothetical protein